jgi:hypothetical protein
MVHIGFGQFHPQCCPTEEVIQRMIEGIQRMIRSNNSSSSQQQEQQPEIPINPAMKRHFELEIERRCKMHLEMQIS